MTSVLSPATPSTVADADAPQAPPRPTTLMRTRQRLTWALGAAWLLDAALQFQPYMFTQDFPKTTLLPTGQGSPGWVSGPVSWAATLMGDHLIVLNTLFGLTQLVIAVGILLPRTRKPALVSSIVWSLLVWWLGEGLGMMFAGPVSVLMGLPGAVILYALIAVIVWPRTTPGGQSVATASPLTAGGAKLLWSAVWTLFVAETLLPANRAPSALHDMVAGMATGEPGWVSSINHLGAALLANHGTQTSIVLAALFAVVAVSVFAPPRLLKPALILAVTLAAVIWTFGEDFGGIAIGHATDPNSGPLLAILALCYWPHNPVAESSDSSTHAQIPQT